MVDIYDAAVDDVDAAEALRWSAAKAIEDMIGVLEADLEDLKLCDDYRNGDHASPYMPDSASLEYRQLAERAVSNRMRLLVDAPVQSLYVEGFRSTANRAAAEADLGNNPAWVHFQKSRMAGRQSTLYEAAFVFGHAFLVAEKDARRDETLAKILSPMRTVALYEDPVNDVDPMWAMTLTQVDDTLSTGAGRAWDEKMIYHFRFDKSDTETPVRVSHFERHGSEVCPVTRFYCHLDSEGRTSGLVKPMIRIQDRLNQTVLDLLVAQTGGAFVTKYATGMVVPKVLDPEGEEVLDGNGQPIPIPVRVDGRTFLTSEDPDTKFGTLDGTPLEGYIAAIEQTAQEWAATGQIPPNHVLGQLANLSAEALAAAETSFSRMVEGFRAAFGESWERHFRIVAEIEGTEGVDDYQGEVVWRDMESQSLSRTADALTKLAQGLDIPVRGLWSRVPGVRAEELAQWHEMWEDEVPNERLDDFDFGDDSEEFSFGDPRDVEDDPIEVDAT